VRRLAGLQRQRDRRLQALHLILGPVVVLGDETAAQVLDLGFVGRRAGGVQEQTREQNEREGGKEPRGRHDVSWRRGGKRTG
jgi:hypothetical protein